MIRVIFAWLIVFGFFFFGIKAIREMTGKELWSLTKLLTYAIICSLLTTAFLIFIVILF